MLIVQKYGGATLATPEKIKQIATRIAHLKKSGKNIVAVVSAMGQTTNQLIQLANQVSKNPSLRELDMLLSVGERTSMALLTMALNDLNCPAISFTGSQAGIFTDESHINANIIDVKAHRVSEALAKNKVVILAGFQGVSPTTKEITTLGRGGSDTTAVAMASYLNADQCEILKDVDHVFSADPKLISEAKPLANLNYDQLLEMTFWGAKVLHYKSVEMAKNKNVKLYVGPADEKNYEQKLNYECAGTWISANYKSEKNIPLAVNSHAKVLEIEMAQDLFFADLVKQQIGFPQILKSQKNTLFISGPAEILSAIEKNYPNKHLNLCSVSLTMTESLTVEIKNQIIQTLNKKNIIVTDMIESSLTFTLILNQEHKTQAIQCLHGLIP
jgi:aspartate kinase